MTRIRYGPKTPEELRAARGTSPVPGVSTLSLTAVWETDPEVVAAVLPPPLEPAASPLASVMINQVEIGGYQLGAGTVAVRARHEGQEGYYPLVMVMTTERALVGGREVFGEPKKLGDVQLHREGDRVLATIARCGVTFAEVRGTITGEPEPPEPRTTLDFYFKFLPAPDGDGFDHDPALVYCTRNQLPTEIRRIAGDLTLRESATDPVADLPVRGLEGITLETRISDQSGRIVTRVPSEWLLPYAHQRYDDTAHMQDGPPPSAASVASAASAANGASAASDPVETAS